ncbi:unnamed protein product [Arctia plantaginis]|uniref:Uncharacterized protein n=1 Tax=Arctia plantaginis TaxID=874455 RepID=A0A8S1BB20_ARCPL|nr:unnamed protein product [Arctia plantaginis]
MCPDQPTYCYPNGCLKKAEPSKKVEVPVTRFSENTKPIFFLEEKNDFMHDLLNKNYNDENKAVPELGVSKQANVMPINHRPDPFKDRYKILLKYKKMPKVELKYNLGEQVKNVKSDVLKKDNVDISKTRWPLNKISSSRISRPRLYSENQGNDDSKFFKTSYSEKEVPVYPPKYFKRELINGTNNNTNGIDINVEPTSGKSEFDNYSYSLEKLIDSLIESSFKPNETVIQVDSKVFQESNKQVIKEAEISTTEQILETTETATTEGITTEVPITEITQINDNTNVISMNLTNENIDKNKYIETDVTNSTDNINEMIASLSKKIELQNNTSLEIMRRMTGNFEFHSIFDKNIGNSTMKENIEVITKENTKMPDNFSTRTRTIKKGRQRLVRKLQNSKKLVAK